MSLKNWILHKMNGMANRVDLPRSPVLSAGVIRSPVVMRRNPGRTTSVTAPGVAPPAAPHLGPYAPLIAAIREELEHFVVSYLRLHLAIAERDRYLLTSIDVRATGPDDADEVPGRRYAIGKGEDCDIVVNGVYASRRHCEIWLDHGSWWVTDAGSTNGIRVERGASVLGRSTPQANVAHEVAVVEVAPGARIVLSARAEGGAADYPRLVLDTRRDAQALATPIAPAVSPPTTPSTPIVAARSRGNTFTIAARMASSVRTVELRADGLPFSVGRSRSQALVIDWAHEGVSGHHIDIVEIDDAGVAVVVHGDNGIAIAGAAYPSGARLRWNA